MTDYSNIFLRLNAGAKLLEGYLEDAGGCDHSVGICMCADYRILDEMLRAIEELGSGAKGEVVEG